MAVKLLDAIDLNEILENALLNECEDWDIDYSISEHNGQSKTTWTVVTPKQAIPIMSGWKIHVSAIVKDAMDILSAVLPTLIRTKVPFKFASSLMILAELNSSIASPSQAGKFLTIYPRNDSEADALSWELHEKTKSFRGPRILSDNPINYKSLVHYRWGGFIAHYIQTLGGEITLAIKDHENKSIPDRRMPFYIEPNWVKNPFKDSENIVKENYELLLNNRYILANLISRSVRGDVFLAIDLQLQQRCVIKLARRDAIVDSLERDAISRLQHEERILHKLANLNNIPKVQNNFYTKEGDYCLAIDDIPEKTLGDYLLIAQNLNQYPTNNDAISLGIKIAEAINMVHQKGIIHGDIKLQNIIITPQNEIRIIDFDAAYDLNEPSSPLGWGTEGFCSPQLTNQGIPNVLDDIYSIGAVLYYYLINATANILDVNHDNLKRRLELVNPGIDARLMLLILNCLSEDPKSRPQSANNLILELERIKDQHKISRNHQKSLTQWSAKDLLIYRSKAIMLAKHLVNKYYQPSSLGAGFISQVNNQNLYDFRGTAGCMLAFSELYRTLKDPYFKKILTVTAQSIETGTQTLYNKIPGLYVGESGVCLSLIKAASILEDQSLHQKAMDQFMAVKKMPHESMDLFNGSAGRLRAALLMWQTNKEAIFLDAAKEAKDAIINSIQIDQNGGIYWLTPDLSSTPYNVTLSSDKIYIGYSHGVAGIADALLDYYFVTKDTSVLAPIDQAIRFILANQFTHKINSSNSGIAWPTCRGDLTASPSFWCHGATGIGKLLLRAHHQGIFQNSELLSSIGALTKDVRWSLPIQCHGLAGNIEYLLDLYQATKQSQYLNWAHDLGKILNFWSDLIVKDTKISNDVKPVEYMSGIPGLIISFLRLSQPELISDIFNVK